MFLLKLIFYLSLSVRASATAPAPAVALKSMGSMLRWMSSYLKVLSQLASLLMLRHLTKYFLMLFHLFMVMFLLFHTIDVKISYCVSCSGSYQVVNDGLMVAIVRKLYI